MIQPLVSVIVPTYNSAEFIGACLHSIKTQTYKNIELIVVDNHSIDDTQSIAKCYADKLYVRGPERSAQRNYGASKAIGEYITFIDSDMELGHDVIKNCVYTINNRNISGVIIHEESFGSNFWANCKALERSFYVGESSIEAARFFKIKDFRKLNGYNQKMISGEDWDLSRRASNLGKIISVDDFIRHNEGGISLKKTLKKKYYYAKNAREYLTVYPEKSLIFAQAGPIYRYILFLRHPYKLFRKPLLGLGMLFMKTCEYIFGFIGYMQIGTFKK